jgi:hypothetical protein
MEPDGNHGIWEGHSTGPRKVTGAALPRSTKMRASPLAPADPSVAAALLAAQQQAWTSQARPAAAPRFRRGGGT